jgi:hypothetical protein
MVEPLPAHVFIVAAILVLGALGLLISQVASLFVS